MKRQLAFALAATLFIACGVSADEAERAAEEQCAVLRTLFSYEKLLRQTEKIVVLVVTDADASPESDAFAAACREQDLFVTMVRSDALNDLLTEMLSAESAVLYVKPGVDTETVSRFALRKGFLTVSDEPTLAESGEVSVSVRGDDGKRNLVVNLTRVEKERHEFSAELLRLARIVR